MKVEDIKTRNYLARMANWGTWFSKEFVENTSLFSKNNNNAEEVKDVEVNNKLTELQVILCVVQDKVDEINTILGREVH